MKIKKKKETLNAKIRVFLAGGTVAISNMVW